MEVLPVASLHPLNLIHQGSLQALHGSIFGNTSSELKQHLSDALVQLLAAAPVVGADGSVISAGDFKSESAFSELLGPSAFAVTGVSCSSSTPHPTVLSGDSSAVRKAAKAEGGGEEEGGQC